jgi:C-terminal processing protease CtpA/Prc
VEGREVTSVDGYEDLDALFKRSISPEGNLVYYPILLKESRQDSLSTPQECDETLTIRYADGTVQELTAEPYQFYRETGDSATSFWQDGDIPVFKFDQWDTAYETEIQEGAEKLKGAAVAFLDLRSNVGGKSAMVANWLRTYSGISRIAGNGVSYNVYTGQADSRLPDSWLNHEDTLVILTGKATASASEHLIDMAYNLENVLLIGENTDGALLGGVSYMQLPNSKCFIGTNYYRVYLTPDDPDYFEEFRGFYPDIWVPAAEAEELAVKLMENLQK